jgi:hypothetical protein
MHGLKLTSNQIDVPSRPAIIARDDASPFRWLEVPLEMVLQQALKVETNHCKPVG